MKRLAILMALAGCGDAAPQWADAGRIDAASCHMATGSYAVDLVETGGDCGPMEAATWTLVHDGEDACLDRYVVSTPPRAARLGYCITEVWGDCLETPRESTILAEVEPASDGSWSGTLVRVEDGAVTCRGDYDIRLSPLE